jgi:hypothetical protein
MTANMTAGPQGEQGVPGPDNDAWYLWVNGTRPMSGNLNMGSHYITSLITGLSGDSAVNKTYVDSVATSYNSTYDAKNNFNASYVNVDNGSYVTVTNTTYVKNNIYGYVSLMTGSAMIPYTNPANVDQNETTTNKNNYIYGEFTNGGSENLQWLVDMPSDWNSADATNGKVSFIPLWTAGSGSGTVEWDFAGKCFPNDAALDTAVAAVGTSTDTLISANDMHIGPGSTAAVITSAGTGGQTCLIKVTRNSGADTLSATAQLIGVRIQYIRTLATV